MSFFKAAVWGIIQGITEFIPVSSSGHLVVIPRFLGIEGPDLISNVALHIGTLAAIIIFFRKEIAALFVSEKRLGFLIICASLPVLLMGLFFADLIKRVFENPNTVGWFFIVNGGIIMAAHARLRYFEPLRSADMGLFKAIAIGIAQSFALLPGISRSGITMTAGIFLGLDRKEAFKFSFLLFLPASIMAVMYSVKEALSVQYVFSPNILLGMLFSAVFGILALRMLYSILMKTRLNILGSYCIALGISTLFVFNR
ncbi:MAG: undecaprenyl-diphosphate phosphatase [Candidatus Omnitrophota bacterium]